MALTWALSASPAASSWPVPAARSICGPWPLLWVALAGLTAKARCLLSGSSPQLLDATLRTIQVPVNQQSVGVGADLGRDPNCQSYQRGSQRLSQTENPLQAGESDLYVLPHSVPPLGWLGGQKDANLGQLFPQLFAAVGKISKHSTGHFLSQFRFSQQLTAQGDIRYVCRCKLVGDGHPVSSTQQVQLHPVDRERTPPYP